MLIKLSSYIVGLHCGSFVLTKERLSQNLVSNKYSGFQHIPFFHLLLRLGKMCSITSSNFLHFCVSFTLPVHRFTKSTSWDEHYLIALAIKLFYASGKYGKKLGDKVCFPLWLKWWTKVSHHWKVSSVSQEFFNSFSVLFNAFIQYWRSCLRFHLVKGLVCMCSCWELVIPTPKHLPASGIFQCHKFFQRAIRSFLIFFTAMICDCHKPLTLCVH